MPNYEQLGKAPTIAVDMIDMRTTRQPEPETIPLRQRQLRSLPSGKMSRSFYLITTNKRLIRRIRPIEEKARKHHEYRNSNNTPEGRGRCDWDGQKYDAPIHRF